MRRFAFVAITFLVGGCSLFVDLDGLTGADAGSDASAFDGSTSDAPIADASDASDANVADATRFTCPDASIVCDDFDETALGAKWTSVTIQNGTLGIDNSASFSPPDSLLITLPDNPGGLIRYNKLDEDIGDLKAIDCELEIRLDATDDTSSYDVRPFALALNPPGFNNYDVHVNMARDQFSLEQNTDNGMDGGSLSQTENFSPVTIGQWQHLRFATDFQTIQIYVDGVKVYDRMLLSPISSASGGEVEVGQGYDTEPPSWTYRIDDVLCTGK